MFQEQIEAKKGQTLNYYLSGEPVSIDEHNWMYIEAKGICLVHEVRTLNNEYVRTDQIFIPFKKIEILGEDLKNARYLQKVNSRTICKKS